MKKILFVCLGNICRSPLAEAIAKEYAEKNNIELEVDSAGTGDWHIGEAPCDNSQIIAKQKGLNISKYKARQVKKEDFDYFDIIVGLDESNMSNLRLLGCKGHIKLGDYGFDGQDVPDPYFFDGFEGFEKVFDMIEVGVINILSTEIKLIKEK